MTGKTHLAAGLAVGLAVCVPHSLSDCAAICLGSAVGSLLCDVDQHTVRGLKEMKSARWLAALICLAALAADEALGGGGMRHAAALQPAERLLAGVAILALTLWKGFRSEHRAFAHSLCAALLLSAGCGLVCPPAAVPLLMGLLSHLALDLLNKKPLRLLWPLPLTLCLHLCASDGKASLWLRRAAALISAALLVWRIVYFVYFMRAAY